jgi:hypothetical protein
MTASGQKATSAGDQTMSALPPKNGHRRWRMRCLFRADVVAKSRKSNNPKNLAKVDLWTSLLLRRFSTPLRTSVIDFG